MRYFLVAACAALVFLANQAGAADRVNKPIDTESLIVKPTKIAADLASQTINIVGVQTAKVVEKDGFIKTFNNLFRAPTPKTHQANGLPLPNQFPSTYYKSYNTPQMPIMVPTRRN